MTKERGSARYGLLSYTGTHNLGDEIQSIASRQFLPRVDEYVDREQLSNYVSESNDIVSIVLNGWFAHHPENWPPSKYLNPLFVAFHISPGPSYKSGLLPKDFFLNKQALKYLKAYEPIGARDNLTLQMLQDSGIESYFSGCMTLTLSRPNLAKDEDLIVLNELPANITNFIKAKTKKHVKSSTHGDVKDGIAYRFTAAESLLSEYAKASCVITSRLHCALPCVAMGVPVFLIDVQMDQERFSGLNNFCNHGSAEDFLSGCYDFDVPPPNPTRHLPYREALISRVSKFIATAQELSDTPYPLSLEDRCDLLRINQSKVVAALVTQKAKITNLEHRINSVVGRVEKLEKK